MQPLALLITLPAAYTALRARRRRLLIAREERLPITAWSVSSAQVISARPLGKPIEIAENVYSSPALLGIHWLEGTESMGANVEAPLGAIQWGEESNEHEVLMALESSGREIQIRWTRLDDQIIAHLATIAPSQENKPDTAQEWNTEKVWWGITAISLVWTMLG